MSGVFRVHWNAFEGEIFRRRLVRRMTLERAAKEGNSPVLENLFALLIILLEYYGERKPCRKQAGLIG
jgi:hypothetical protein